MNAFLLMTAALVAGDNPAPAAQSHAPIVSTAPVNGCAGGGCGGTVVYGNYGGCGCQTDCCEEGFFSKLRGRFSGLFSRNNCCEPSCNTCNTCTTPTYTHHHYTTSSNCGCQTQPSCCGNTWSFGSRLRGMFRRNDCCDSYNSCNTCNSCGTYSSISGAPVAGTAVPPGPMPKIEDGTKIPAPKDAQKLPAGTPPMGGTAPMGTAPAQVEPPVPGNIDIDNPVAGPVPVNEPSLNIVPPAIPSPTKAPF